MESDQFMPEYWPANRIIGKLEKALVKAENILGLIQSEQIANLVAGKVTGLLTSAQIEAVEAAKIAGQLTNAQLKEIEAAKITGQISNAQLAANSVTAEKIAGATITGEKIAGLTITGEKIAGATITGAKIVANTITAEKLSVATLSAISANLGTVTAGTLKGVIFEDSEAHFRVSPEGIILTAGLAGNEVIRWKTKLTEGITLVEIGGTTEPDGLDIFAPAREKKEANIVLTAHAHNGVAAEIHLTAKETGFGSVLAQNSAVSKFIIKDNGESDFVQIAGGPAKKVVQFLRVVVTFSGGSSSNIVEVPHALGSNPNFFVGTINAGTLSSIWFPESTAGHFKVQAFFGINFTGNQEVFIIVGVI
jgi:hypothetical protein